MLGEVLNPLEPQQLSGLLLRFEKLCGFLRGGSVGNALGGLVAGGGSGIPLETICPAV